MIKFFILQIKYYLIAIFFLLTQGCSSVENISLVDGITTAVAPEISPNIVNGSLFQEKTPISYGYQPLFEDHRPHNIGDIVTVVLQENISASNSSFSNLSRNGSTNLGIGMSSNDTNPGLNINNNNTGFNSIGKNDFSGRGSNSAKNTFSGLITTTVQKVFPNGNLKIIGEKQVAINKGTEYIRFSGVINPNNINKNNFIISTQIADTRIEYLSHGNIDEIHKMGWLQRLFSKFSPI